MGQEKDACHHVCGACCAVEVASLPVRVCCAGSLYDELVPTVSTSLTLTDRRDRATAASARCQLRAGVMRKLEWICCSQQAPMFVDPRVSYGTGNSRGFVLVLLMFRAVQMTLCKVEKSKGCFAKKKW